MILTNPQACASVSGRMATRYSVYVDESGDEGIGTGSEWFLLAGVVLTEQEGAALGKALTELKTRRRRPAEHVLHWNKEKPPAKEELAAVLARERFRMASSIWHCYDPSITTVWRPNLLYYAAALDLAVNVTELMRAMEGDGFTLTFFFEEAGGGVRAEVLDFLLRHSQIPAEVLEEVDTAKKQERLLLQAADAVGGALYNACPRRRGEVTQTYARYLRNHTSWGSALPDLAFAAHPPGRRAMLAAVVDALGL